MKKVRGIGVLVFVLCILIVTGCSVTDSGKEKVADIDFTVVTEEQIPKEVKEVIEEKKTEEFRVVFTSEENMYIVVGYGMKETSGYSIAVKDLYRTENAIRIDTNLIGPQKGETINEEPTYPYIVIMIESMDLPIVFD
ncbi:MAG: protease complex subunit PrcB family protein [Lachnospiraceae bacterium]